MGRTLIGRRKNTVWGGGNKVNGCIVESVSAKLASWIYIICLDFLYVLHIHILESCTSSMLMLRGPIPHPVENRHIFYVAVRSNHFKNSVIGQLAIDISTQPLHFY